MQRIFVDTNVLFPFSVMDVLLALSEDGVHEVLWTETLLSEWERVVTRDHKRSPATAASITAAVREFFADSEVSEGDYANRWWMIPHHLREPLLNGIARRLYRLAEAAIRPAEGWTTSTRPEALLAPSDATVAGPIAQAADDARLWASQLRTSRLLREERRLRLRSTDSGREAEHI